ncbi:hypothetical protein F2P81_019000 [Scophthalmus maximus]|uniref:Uncharacterized protein n=1 Tax=Scophthalmus maximus TaxID=52904 RepID=A0A6A4SBT0_SCOMX|nr:hypothetical protein F2P81_019000 [Scophthalmus maximus]
MKTFKDDRIRMDSPDTSCKQPLVQYMCQPAQRRRRRRRNDSEKKHEKLGEDGGTGYFPRQLFGPIRKNLQTGIRNMIQGFSLVLEEQKK